MSCSDSAWLRVVGVGDEGLEGLGSAARRLVDTARVLVGSPRHLAMLPRDGRQQIPWPSPFSPMPEVLETFRNQPVCVLATGDPCCHGVGTVLARHFPLDELHIVPSPSAYSLACARLGWSQPQIDCLSLHGRPLAELHPFVQPGARLLVLSANRETPVEVADLLRTRGYGPSRMTVFSHMGGVEESRCGTCAARWPPNGDIADFNTIAIECEAGPDAQVLPRAPGLPDEAFEHDGQLTKRELRAITLAALGPVARQHLWDVGAGCGSVAIEWMRHDCRCTATAVERSPTRAQIIARNASALGTPGLEVVVGSAPEQLAGLAPPHAVFVGGGASNPALLNTVWQALLPGGRLVVNAVTVESEAAIIAWQREQGGDLLRLALSHAAPVGRYLGWRPAMPVTQLRAVKGPDRA